MSHWEGTYGQHDSMLAGPNCNRHGSCFNDCKKKTSKDKVVSPYSMLASPIANIIGSFVKTIKTCFDVPCSMLARCSHDFPLQTHILEKNMVQKRLSYVPNMRFAIKPYMEQNPTIQKLLTQQTNMAKKFHLFFFWRMLNFGRVYIWMYNVSFIPILSVCNLCV